MPIISLSTGGIIAIVVSVLVVLVGATIALYFTVFSYLRLNKQCRDLFSSFEKDHALLFGQVRQYLSRMESISSTNLTYIDQFTQFKKQFSDLRDTEDANAQSAVNSLKDLLKMRRTKDLKTYLPEAKKTIEAYHESVSSLHALFEKTFAEENDIREASRKQKDDYREAKRLFQSRQDDLSLVSETFLALFKKMDDAFSESDALVENARYGEAREVLEQRISPVVVELRRILAFLPDVCVTITTLIPEKISSLKNRYDELSSVGYPLNHILIKPDIDAMESELSALSDKVKGLRVQGVQEELSAMRKKLDGYFQGFQNEIDARDAFEKGWESSYEKENVLEREVIALNNSLPRVRKIYLITPDDQNEVEAINEAIRRATGAKQALNTSVHSSTRQPYSSLLKKLTRLQEESGEAEKKIRAFQTRLISLKDDTNRAFLSLESYSRALEQAEVDLRSFEIPEILLKTAPMIEDIHIKIDALHDILETTPINVFAVNRAYEDLKSAGDSFLNAVKTTKDDLEASEKAIVRANAYRIGDNAADMSLRQAESLFYKMEFKKALAIANEAVEGIRSRSELSR